jgi:RimJ/RimL family protein N-acetyltransferase
MDLERDPDVMRYLNGGTVEVPEQGDPQSLYLMPRGSEDHVWSARRTSNGAFAGWFCLWPENASVAELGYRLRRADWNQGLASEGAAALIGWGFETQKYERIFATTMTANHASRRVLEKIGMRLERTVMVEWAAAIPGGDEGEAFYEVTRSRWKAADQ